MDLFNFRDFDLVRGLLLSYFNRNHRFRNGSVLQPSVLTFDTLVIITKALRELLEQVHTADRKALTTLSPYGTEHINRFGNYILNPNRTPEPLEQHLQIALGRNISVYGIFDQNPCCIPISG
jgi:hypothetical protein